MINFLRETTITKWRERVGKLGGGGNKISGKSGRRISSGHAVASKHEHYVIPPTSKASISSPASSSLAVESVTRKPVGYFRLRSCDLARKKKARNHHHRHFSQEEQQRLQQLLVKTKNDGKKWKAEKSLVILLFIWCKCFRYVGSLYMDPWSAVGGWHVICSRTVLPSRTKPAALSLCRSSSLWGKCIFYLCLGKVVSSSTWANDPSQSVTPFVKTVLLW